MMLVEKRHGATGSGGLRPLRQISTEMIGNIGALVLLCCNLLATALIWQSNPGMPNGLVGAYTGLAVFAAGASIFLRLGVVDLYRQLSYRDRFFLIVLFVALAMSSAFLGFRRIEVYILGYTVLQSLLYGESKLAGRLFALHLTILTILILRLEDYPGIKEILLYLGLLLSFIRIANLNGYLELHHEEEGVMASAFLGRTLFFIAVPIFLGWLIFVVLSGFLVRSIPTLIIEEQGSELPSIEPRALLQLFGLAVLTGLLFMAARFIQSKLVRKKAIIQPDLGNDESILTYRQATISAVKDLLPDESKDARGRVIRAFEHLSNKRIDKCPAREPSDTPHEYFIRLGLTSLEAVIDRADVIFSRACYSNESVSDDEATFFEAAVNEIIASVDRQ